MRYSESYRRFKSYLSRQQAGRARKAIVPNLAFDAQGLIGEELHRGIGQFGSPRALGKAICA